MVKLGKLKAPTQRWDPHTGVFTLYSDEITRQIASSRIRVLSKTLNMKYEREKPQFPRINCNKKRPLLLH